MSTPLTRAVSSYYGNRATASAALLTGASALTAPAVATGDSDDWRGDFTVADLVGTASDTMRSEAFLAAIERDVASALAKRAIDRAARALDHARVMVTADAAEQHSVTVRGAW